MHTVPEQTDIRADFFLPGSRVVQREGLTRLRWVKSGLASRAKIRKDLCWLLELSVASLLISNVILYSSEELYKGFPLIDNGATRLKMSLQ